MGRFYYALMLLFFIASISYANEGNKKKYIHDVTIYWDASLSQKTKNLQKELEFLDVYFKGYPNSKVKLVVFNTRVVLAKDFEVKDSNWKTLKEKLEKVVYDGGADFSLIKTKLDTHKILFFTDGEGSYGNIDTYLYSPSLITISSKRKINKRFLHRTALYNQGFFVNLLESNLMTSIKAIKTEKTQAKLKFEDEVGNKKSYIKVYVSGQDGFLVDNIETSINHKNRVTLKASIDGSFKIKAKPGDKVMFSYLGKETKTILIRDYKALNVVLSDDINQLEAITLKNKSKAKKQKVKIGGLVKDKRRLGYAVTSLDATELKPERAVSLVQLLRGRIPGYTIPENDLSKSFMRGGASSLVMRNQAPAFVVDGILIEINNTAKAAALNNMIDLNNIHNITVLKGLAASNRYGNFGANGVIIITTKSGLTTFDSKKKESKKNVEVKYTIFDKPLEIEKEGESKYIKALKVFKDTDLAYNHYLSQRKYHEENPEYFINSSSYFFENNEEEKGVQVLSNLTELFPDDVVVLKTMTYQLDKYGLYLKSKKVHEKILKLMPNMSQNYLDLANNYVLNKEYQNAINVFKKIAKNEYEAVTSWNGIQDQVTNDFKNLMFYRNPSWNTRNIDVKYFKKIEYDVRLVIECANFQTEYELEYISPERKGYTISHTKEKAKEVLNNELREGYNSYEFTQKNMEKGTWYLNIHSKNEINKKKPQSRFIKVKVYTNYGRSNEKLQTYILDLNKIKQSRLFTSFSI